MTETTASTDPAEALLQVMTAYVVPQALYAFAALGVADCLIEGPQQTETLAGRVGADPSALARLLRALSTVGIVAEAGDGAYAETPLSRCLVRDAPGSVRASVLVAGEQHYRAWGELLYSVRTGAPAFEHVFGRSCYDYLAAHPEAGELFDRSMRETGEPQWDRLVASYEFPASGTVVDVGGGHGALLAAVLRAHPGLRGVLFDLPTVIEGARAYLAGAGVAERCRIVGGSFFDAVPSGGDVYLLVRTLLNWSSEQAALILRRCREAMPPGSRLLVGEPLLPPRTVPFSDAFNDLNLLVLGGGQMLTEAELARLFTRARLRLTRVLPTGTRLKLVEGVTDESR